MNSPLNPIIDSNFYFLLLSVELFYIKDEFLGSLYLVWQEPSYFV